MSREVFWQGGSARAARIVAVLALLFPFLPAGAAEAADRSVEPSQARAALQSVRDAFAAVPDDQAFAADGHGHRAGRGITEALQRLFVARGALDGVERREADAYFLRPTDGSADPFGDGYTVPPSAVDSIETAHFKVHYVTDPSSPDAATAAYAVEVGRIFEEVWAREVTELRWVAPAPDGALGGDGRTDVYIAELSDSGAFGYAAADPDNSCQSAAVCNSFHGFMVVDNDYVGYPPTPAGALRATAAHEFNHLSHFTLAYTAEGWFYEASGVWMESQAYPAVDARTFYVADFADLPGLPLTDFARSTGGFDRAYGAYVWNLWLADRYGPDIVREAWIAAAGAGNFSLAGYDGALAAEDGGISSEFVAFAAATAEWNHNEFPADGPPYPDVARGGAVPSDGRYDVTLDHTAYELRDVAPQPTVTVTVEGPQGVGGGVALVALEAGTVRTVVDDTLADGAATATLTGVGNAERVTAVVVNSDFALSVPRSASSFDDPQYANDCITYAVGVNAEPVAPAGGGPCRPGTDPPPGPGPDPEPEPGGLTDGGRLDGGGRLDPVAQTVATSRALFADGTASRVVLATADRFPDALAGSALAGDRGPILLTSGLGPLDPRVEAEIARVTGGEGVVLVLGGRQAVSDEAAAAARAAGGDLGCAAPLPDSCRYAGAGREATAALIARTVWDENPAAPPIALVARGDQFADAISGGAFAAAAGVPVLLTPSNTANAHTVEFLAQHDVDETIVLGGRAAVDDATAAQLPGGQVSRVAGPERTATAVQIAARLWQRFGAGRGGVVLVNVRDPDGWQTALSAAVASARHDAPQLGVENPPALLGPETAGHLFDVVVGPVQAFGDLTLVSDAQLQEAVAERDAGFLRRS